MLDNIVSASGKFGGVAGVFAGVINYENRYILVLVDFFHRIHVLNQKLTENPALFFGMAASWKYMLRAV